MLALGIYLAAGLGHCAMVKSMYATEPGEPGLAELLTIYGMALVAWPVLALAMLWLMAIK